MKTVLAAYSVLAAAALLAGSFAFTQWQARRIAERFPPRGQFVDVEGQRISFTSQGAGPAVVLVHGASGNEADLRLPLAGLLTARGFRVISFDRPGHGWSDRREGDESPARQAQVLRHSLEKLGVKKAVVAGHSLAGAMTLQLALDHHDLVAGVVLIAPVTHPWPGGIAAYYNLTATPVLGPFFVNTLMSPFALGVFDNSLRKVFSPQDVPHDYRARTGVELVLRPSAFRANAIDVAAMHEFVARESKRYGQIRIPVSIVTGDRDVIVLTHIHSEGSARDIPGAKLHILPGVGHSPHWTKPDEVAARIGEIAAGALGVAQAGR